MLAHGWPWSSCAWHRVFPTLVRTQRIDWFDLLGDGRSQKGLSQQTGLDAQGLVFLKMLAHLLHGAEYASLVLMNVVAMQPWGSDFFDNVGRHIDAFRGLPPHVRRAIIEDYILVRLLPRLRGMTSMHWSRRG
jgi:hypothetical protein